MTRPSEDPPAVARRHDDAHAALPEHVAAQNLCAQKLCVHSWNGLDLLVFKHFVRPQRLAPALL